MHREPRRALGPFESVIQAGPARYIKARHKTREAAAKRLADAAHHRRAIIIDHRVKLSPFGVLKEP